ncbi:MAG: Xaa-Pro peptidase family protein [Spirochaetes bacterium]|nr:Xaa-Pro peptidase family protein [Spirochaetota bacterium]MBU1079758.1 Xaa-Pro peptidase family protein [Spirochaetota bacterium]
MRRRGLDAYIVSSGDNIWYLTGLVYQPEERPFFIVLPAEGRPTLIVPTLEARHLAAPPIDCDIAVYWEFPSPKGSGWSDILRKTLKGARSVGVGGKMKASVIEEIRDLSPAVTDIVEELRLVKSPVEVGMIRRSAAIASAAMGKLLKSICKGGSVVESFMVSKSVQTGLIKSGAFNPLSTQLLTAAWPAPQSSMPHSVPSLESRFGNRGPNVAMCYFRVNGYAAECERTFFLDTPSPDDVERFALIAEARRRALAALRPRALCSEIDEAANGYLREKGCSEQLLHRTGHGIGLGNHEEPWLAEGDDRPLREGMVVSVEPGLYFSDRGGYRHSDTVLITEDGYEILTSYPVSLEEMAIGGGSVGARIRSAIVRSALRGKSGRINSS